MSKEQFIETQKVKKTTDSEGNVKTEISSSIEKRRVKCFEKEIFFKLFAKNIAMFQGIQSVAGFKVLFILLKHCAEYNDGNNIYLGYGIPAYLCRKYDIHKPTFFKGVKELRTNNIIIAHSECNKKGSKFENCYCWNPFILGQGNPADIHLLRQTIQIDYDFTNLTMETMMKAEQISKNGLSIINNPQHYEVESTIQNGNDSEVIVRQKNQSKKKLHN